LKSGQRFGIQGSSRQQKIANNQFSAMAFTTKNLAVFIDYENFARDRFETEILLNRLQRRGRLLVKRAYADWGRFAGAKHSMLRAAVDLIELPSHAAGKNQADIRLVVDALEIAMTRDYIDTFVLVSGDSDMSPLVSKLREWNRYVIVVARPNNISSLLAGCCDEFICYQDLVQSHPAESLNAIPVDGALDLARAAWKELRDSGGPMRGSLLKSRMLRLSPGFNEQRHGCRQFKDFIQLLVAGGVLGISPREDGDFDLFESGDPQTFEPKSTSEIAGETQIPADLALEVSPPAIVSANEDFKQTNNPNDQWIDVIWWAFNFAVPLPATPANSISLSRLVSKIQRLFPDFSPEDYGFSRSGGYKKMLQALEADQWCELQSDSKGGFVIHWLPEFLSHVPTIPKPAKVAKKFADANRYSPDRIFPLRVSDLIAESDVTPRAKSTANSLRQQMLIPLLEDQTSD
jgi:uncharacterized LabA/DUF88 family protein